MSSSLTIIPSASVNWVLACLAYSWLDVVFWRCTVSAEIGIRVLGYVFISLTAFAGTFGLFPAVLVGVDNRYDSDKQLADYIYFHAGQCGCVAAGTTELQVQVS